MRGGEKLLKIGLTDSVIERESEAVSLTLPFGVLLRQIRKRAGMTQRDLAAALGYSDSLISGLETGQRQPDLETVRQRFLPALGLQDDPALAARLLEAAAAARGEQLPAQQRNPAPPASARQVGTTARHRLPALPIQVIGRDESIHQIGNRLLGHGGRLLTLVGPPGVGKTTLALAVAERVQHLYADGAYFLPLAAVNDNVFMAGAILTHIAPGDASGKPPHARLVELLRHKTALLVLDNLEQIDGAPSLIATLLAECPGVTVLATSRERLHLRAEQRFQVPPLALAPAIELFVQRAQAVDGDFRLTEHNGSTLSAICTRLDCLPLALELCAAQIEIFTSAQLLAQLQAHSLDLLVDGATDLPPHQRTLRAAIQHSYDLLSEDEQRLFRRLGVFVGGFDLAAVEGIGDWRLEIEDDASPISNLQFPISALRSLIAKSLVRVESGTTGEQRFSLLETIREFALEQLRAQGEEEAARQRHYNIFLQRFRDADSHLRGPDASNWLRRLQPEQENLRAALQWTQDRGLYSDGAWLVLAAAWFWEQCNQQYEASKWLLPLMAHFQTLIPDLRLAIWIILNAYGDYTAEGADLIKRFAEEGRGLIPNSLHLLLQSAAWQVIADKSSDPVEAAAARERTIALGRVADGSPLLGSEFGLLADRDFLMGFGLWRYALALAERGAFTQATSLAQESLALFQARGNRYEQAGGLGTLGLVALLQGDLEGAQKLLDEALACATTNNTRWMASLWQPLLALVMLYRDEAATARQLLIESWEYCIDLKRTHLLPRISIFLAETALWEGHINEAENWLAQGVNDLLDPRRLGSALTNYLHITARLAVTRQAYRQATLLLGLAEETRQRARVTLVGPVRVRVDAALAEVQAALGPTLFAEAFAAGQQMILEEAFYALQGSDHAAM